MKSEILHCLWKWPIFLQFFRCWKSNLQLRGVSVCKFTKLPSWQLFLLITNLLVSKSKQGLSKIYLASPNWVFFALLCFTSKILRISEFVPCELKTGYCTVKGVYCSGSFWWPTSMFARDLFRYFLIFAMTGFRVTKLNTHLTHHDSVVHNHFQLYFVGLDLFFFQ